MIAFSRSIPVLVAVGAAISLRALVQTSRAPEPPAGAAPATVRTFTDDFSTDTRSHYEITGPVRWEQGKMILGQAGSIQRRIEPGHFVDVAMNLVWPTVSEKKPEAQVRVAFLLKGRDEVSVVVTKRIESGHVSWEVPFFDTGDQGEGQDAPATNAPKAIELRRFPDVAPPGSAPLRLGYSVPGH